MSAVDLDSPAQSLFPHKSSSEIAWIGSAQLCLFFLGVAFASPHIHKDYSRGILASGSALSILSILFVPEAKTYGQVLVIQGILGGLGAGTLFASALGIQCHWFDEKRALAVSIVAGGGSVGGVCGPSASFFLSSSSSPVPPDWLTLCART
mgnify:CR=1 FL=1